MDFARQAAGSCRDPMPTTIVRLSSRTAGMRGRVFRTVSSTKSRAARLAHASVEHARVGPHLVPSNPVQRWLRRALSRWLPCRPVPPGLDETMSGLVVSAVDLSAGHGDGLDSAFCNNSKNSLGVLPCLSGALLSMILLEPISMWSDAAFIIRRPRSGDGPRPPAKVDRAPPRLHDPADLVGGLRGRGRGAGRKPRPRRVPRRCRRCNGARDLSPCSSLHAFDSGREQVPMMKASVLTFSFSVAMSRPPSASRGSTRSTPAGSSSWSRKIASQAVNDPMGKLRHRQTKAGRARQRFYDGQRRRAPPGVRRVSPSHRHDRRLLKRPRNASTAAAALRPPLLSGTRHPSRQLARCEGFARIDAMAEHGSEHQHHAHWLCHVDQLDREFYDSGPLHDPTTLIARTSR